MQLAVRSYLAAGVTFAGIGALVAGPVAPPMPDVPALAAHSSAAVELSALVNPIAEYANAFAVAFKNVQALGAQIGQDPAPILTQIVKNQLGSATDVGTFVKVFGQSVLDTAAETPQHLQTALRQFGAGNVTGALNTLLNTALGPIVQAVFNTLFLEPDVYAGFQNALRQPLANLLNVVDLASSANVGNLLGPLLAPVQVLTDITNAVGAAGDGIFAGVKTGNLEQVANAVLSLGPDVTYAILNGGPSAGDFGAGLFGPTGIVSGLLTIRDLIAGAIAPHAPASSASAVTTVTLDVAPGAKSLTVAKAPAQSSGAGTVSAADGAAAAAPGSDESANDQPAGTPTAAGAIGTPKKVSGGLKHAAKGSGAKSGKPAKAKPSTASRRSTAKAASSSAG
jgi:hypothetical protein